MPYNSPHSGGSDPRRTTRGYWTFPESSSLSFVAPTDNTYGPTTAITRTFWRTPTFDLRAGLGLSDGYAQLRQKNIEPDVMLGVEFDLFVDITVSYGISNPANFGFYCIEFGHSMDPQKVAFLQARQNISSQVNGGYVTGAIGVDYQVHTNLRWTPYGPLRYWGVAIVCDQLLADPTPAIRLAAALH